MMITPKLYMGAEGGGRTTNSIEEAIRRNAFIKVRPVDSRGTNFVFANPFVSERG